MADGCVWFVGAGPGDPDLLTVKAAKLLARAEVVVFDRLVSPEILDLLSPDAERVFVGKTAGRHPVPQDEINAILRDRALAGQQVVRLKGGDPFVFGRGSEEAAFLVRHGVHFSVVPGVTAASGCAAAAGIPLTHRGLATGVRFVTGHVSNDGELDLDWAGLADPETTLVIYMGLGTLSRLCARLMAEGLPADTPAAAIAEGTTPRQRVCVATLETLAHEVATAGLCAPVLTIVGRVVALETVLRTEEP